MSIHKNKEVLKEGLRDGIPIGLGYFAVAFSLGILAKVAGLTPFQGFLASILNNASAGQYAGFALIATGGTYLEIILITLIANGRYLLMSCALSQRLAPDTSIKHRLLLGYDIADELFGITIARPGFINPYYTYGAILIAAPSWATGTALGIMAGNILPIRIVSALSVALYGMFLAVIIPPAKKEKKILYLILFCFGISFIISKLPIYHYFSEGTWIIILTIIISILAAVIFPMQEKMEVTENVS